MRKGAYDYLVKPLDLDRLDEVVGRCLADRRTTGDLRDALPPPQITNGGLVGRHPVMMDLYKTVGTLAASRAAVLIRGETGTGKELIARAIHENSASGSAPFVPVNCAAVPESLLESELFGHVRGAFTGATSDRMGRFEIAGDGTVFLDEIGDTTLAFQSKLLRILQEREFYRVGGEELRRTRARVIAATHQPLEELVREGRFREDLYFRLQVVEVRVPSLRERRSDIPLLVSHLLADLARRDWPGNVRELENVLTRAVALCRGPGLSLRDVGSPRGDDASPVLGAPEQRASGASEPSDDTLEGIERRYVQQVLMRTGGNKSAAARILDISRPRLDRMIDRHHLIT
jgi:DNA-binding NtrC family response regulator